MEMEKYREWLDKPFEGKSSLTVAVLSCHEFEYTKVTLDSVIKVANMMPNIDTEILVTEDARLNNDLEIHVEKLKEVYPNIRYVAVPEDEHTGNVTGTRKVAIKNARNKYLVFVDGDDMLIAGAAKAYSKAIELLETNKKLALAEFKIANSKDRTLSFDSKVKSHMKYPVEKLRDDFTLAIPERYDAYLNKKCPFYGCGVVQRTKILQSLKIYNVPKDDYCLRLQQLLVFPRHGFIDEVAYIHFTENEYRGREAVLQRKRWDTLKEYSRDFVRDYADMVLNQPSKNIQKMFINFAKGCVGFDFMSLGSSCADIYVARDFCDQARLRGPVDNLHSRLGFETIKVTLNKSLIQEILETDPIRTHLETPRKDNNNFQGEHLCDVESTWEHFRTNHNDFEDERVRKEFAIRVQRLYDYIDNLGPCNFLVYAMGPGDYDENGLIKERFEAGLKAAKEAGILDKIIFLATGPSVGGFYKYGWKKDILAIDPNLHVAEGTLYSPKPLVEKYGRGTLPLEFLKVLFKML